MSRIPPGLLYLTIYNPTLRPQQLTIDNDEDAEEQAHILFYTARETAVSRDRILRQVGLAKALINFSGMFDSSSPCENVHSQTRRMIMVSPEPHFWIHACIELAKTPRTIVNKSKGKGKNKEPPPKQETVYDYHDGSIHDNALRKHILRGYEQFKLVHGSFTSILSSLGQEALELQLERFFTVWAWKWDAEEDADFADNLGPPLHPKNKTLTPILNEFNTTLTPDTTAFALIPPYVIPSTKLIESNYPVELALYIVTRIPPPPPPSSIPPASTDEPAGEDKEPQSMPNKDTKPPDKPKQPNAFVNMTNAMDVRKWSWPGYLTFGKNSSGRSSVTQTPSSTSPPLPESTQPGEGKHEPVDGVDSGNNSGLVATTLKLDTESLMEAMETDHSRSPSVYSARGRSRSPAPSTTPLDPDQQATQVSNDANEPAKDCTEDATDVAVEDSPQVPIDGDSAQGVDSPDEKTIERTPMNFLFTTVHLSNPTEPSMTTRRRVYHVTRENITLALVMPNEDPVDTTDFEDDVEAAFDSLKNAVETESENKLDASIPSVAKLLEPKDKWIISHGPYTTSSPNFATRSSHLFNGQQLLHSDLDVLEVFSRGQNPQHWHISKRGLGVNKEGKAIDGEAFMEIARKESTLTDVDNELASVVRQFLER
ncbi:hypothetical protein K474DRAFT_1661283 [Panus rudis PR-1116 ss-1]|nr:hypothetical protein K474DRAFT_1661283 [Panus rudis PR-1116 ss-1]